MPQKVSLAFLGLIVILLLAPYTGCNEASTARNTPVAPSSEREEIEAAPSLRSPETSPKKDQSLDQIEELLSD